MKTNKIKDFFDKMSITNKITALYAIVFFLMLLVVSGFLIINAYLSYQNTSREELEQTAEIIAEHIRSGGETDADTIENVNPNKYVEVRITNLTNLFLMDFFSFPIGEHTPFREPLEEERNNFPPHNKENERYMNYRTVIEYQGNIYAIEVFRSISQWEKTGKTFLGIFIVFNLLGILIAYLIGKYISKKLLKPVVDITQTAGQISIDDLSKRIEVPVAKDEIQKLAITFNDMISRLDNSFDRQKEFISDASHELRTPISVIQGYANLINRWGKTDPEVLQESIDSIEQETKYMATLVEKLLFLARDDRNSLNVEKERISLNQVFEIISKDISVMDLGNKKIDITQEEDVYILGDFDLVKQLILIFIDNGIKYTKEDGIIQVSLKKDNENAYISIKDNGIGIAKEDINKIFNRFYRSDKSRSKQLVSGTGLGLSIAESLLKIHNGKVSVVSELEKGTEFEIVLNLYNDLEVK